MKNMSHLCEGCLGALDGTYIDVHVPISEKGWYRNRKGQVSVNVLGVCDMNMRFVYVLTRWKGSAADSRVLRNAINKENGLNIPRGKYYLCDNGYPNCEGFLTPYKGVRYHLNEWTSRRPQTYQEYFNMKHTRARNVVERTFRLLKMRWGYFVVRRGIQSLLQIKSSWVMDCTGIRPGQYGDKMKCVRGRRSWSKIEEDAIILCLINVVIEGWKFENGFKAGFQRELEKGMRRIIPNTDIVATPHINSKIHVWKKEYGALSDLLSKSGIGWNSTTSIIEVEDESVWDSCRRWIEIFGKDRATGENVVDHIDIINEMYKSGMDQDGDVRERFVPLSPEGPVEKDDNLTGKPVDPCLNVMLKGKKRKTIDSDISMLVESLGEFMKFSKVAMTDFNNGVDKGSGSSSENKQLNEIMKGLLD
ncbi:hypothetical protein ACS0TY_002143 [Phlomoides rotata]